jgi:hypothetical protein
VVGQQATTTTDSENINNNTKEKNIGNNNNNNSAYNSGLSSVVASRGSAQSAGSGATREARSSTGNVRFSIGTNSQAGGDTNELEYSHDMLDEETSDHHNFTPRDRDGTRLHLRLGHANHTSSEPLCATSSSSSSSPSGSTPRINSVGGNRPMSTRLDCTSHMQGDDPNASCLNSRPPHVQHLSLDALTAFEDTDSSGDTNFDYRYVSNSDRLCSWVIRTHPPFHSSSSNFFVHTCIHTYVHTYIHTCIRTSSYIHTYIHTDIHTYMHAYVHTYIHTYRFQVIPNAQIAFRTFLKLSLCGEINFAPFE